MEVDSKEAMERLREDLLAVVGQGLEFLKGLDQEAYQRARPELGLSSIGAHYRHHLDHVEAWLSGVEKGRIDYDDRRKNMAVEVDRQAALGSTEDLCQRLRGEKRTREEILVLQRSRDDGERRREVKSTVERELLFVLSHAIHHYAIMGLAARLSGVKPPSCFGVMPATREYHRQREPEGMARAQ